MSFILVVCLLGTRELLGAQEIGGGSASVATGYDLSGLRATHSDLLASGAWSSNAAGETSQARGRPVVNDLLGRVTSLDGWNHTYSCDGLLLSSEPSAPAEGSRRSTHAYDALGRRVRTVVQAYVGGQWVAFSTTERDFIGRLPLGIETSFADGSSKSWRFLRGPDVSGSLEGAGGARGVLAVLKDASSWKAVAADTLGNVLALAGTNGDFTRRTFDPWGNPLTRDAVGKLHAATLNERRADYDALPLAWASQEVDPDTGLSHYHFREYSPSLGGWLTTDPIGLAGGYLNLRSYLGNRPADALDVWGEKYESDWLIEGREMEARGEVSKGRCLQILGALTSGWNATLHINQEIEVRMSEVDAEYRNGELQGSKSKGEVALYRFARSQMTASELGGGRLLSSTAKASSNIPMAIGAFADGVVAYPGRVKEDVKAVANNPGSVNVWSDLGADAVDGVLTVSVAKGLVGTAKSVSSRAGLLGGLTAEGEVLRLKVIENARIDCKCLVTATGAESAKAGLLLRTKLAALEKAQSNPAFTRILADGRIRYYEPEISARTLGPTRGASYVTEYNPKNGMVRSWIESYDQSGEVNRVHPKMVNGQIIDSQHYPPTAKELGQ